MPPGGSPVSLLWVKSGDRGQLFPFVEVVTDVTRLGGINPGVSPDSPLSMHSSRQFPAL